MFLEKIVSYCPRILTHTIFVSKDGSMELGSVRTAVSRKSSNMPISCVTLDAQRGKTLTEVV